MISDHMIRPFNGSDLKDTNEELSYFHNWVTARFIGFHKKSSDRLGVTFETILIKEPFRVRVRSIKGMAVYHDKGMASVYHDIDVNCNASTDRSTFAEWDSSSMDDLMRITNAFSNPQLLPTCIGMGFDGVISEYMKEFE